MVSSMGGDSESTQFTPGDRLPDDVLDHAQKSMAEHLCAPRDVAEAVLWAITRPAGVHLASLVVRPKKDLSL
jgi:NADP-dependent 3-hydroxy acid dehydrogenase YdfG